MRHPAIGGWQQLSDNPGLFPRSPANGLPTDTQMAPGSPPLCPRVTDIIQPITLPPFCCHANLLYPLNKTAAIKGGHRHFFFFLHFWRPVMAGCFARPVNHSVHLQTVGKQLKVLTQSREKRCSSKRFDNICNIHLIIVFFLYS